MRQLVTRIIKKITTSEQQEIENSTNSNIVCGVGMMVYHVERRGYFSIQDDNGRDFFPFNAKQFPKVMKDHFRVRFTLECFPSLGNYYGNGLSARIIRIEPYEQ